MIVPPFERSEHVYTNDAFAELVKDAIRFFNGTPVHGIDFPNRFYGTGVYALYYTGENPIYDSLKQANRLAYDLPIYVGKAVPKGWRQGRMSDSALNQSRGLHSRLKEHKRNIEISSGIEVDDFTCRFVIFENAGSDMISTVEAALIRLFRPLWNTTVDGFGNHTPGAGRFEQAKSDWDVIHPGRVFAEKCKGISRSRELIEKNIIAHFSKMVQL
ncbi:MAG: hypothetical protein RL186_939 [Pseudomonadota bacterium]|jgi:hypothetical protein